MLKLRQLKTQWNNKLSGRSAKTAGFSQAQRAQAAQLQGALGAQAQQLGQRDKQLFGIGSLQQGMQQRLLDTARQNALHNRLFRSAARASDIFRGVPTMQTTSGAKVGTEA